MAKRPLAPGALATPGPEVQVAIEGREPPRVTIMQFDVARDGRLLTMRLTDDDRPQSPRRVLVQNWRAAIAR